MRNLSEYPITYAEAIKVLDQIFIDIQTEPLNELRCGDMRLAVIHWTKEQLLQKHLEEFFDK